MCEDENIFCKRVWRAFLRFRHRISKQVHMKERAWFEHLRKYCSEYRKSKKASDLCDICLHYDRCILPLVPDLIANTKQKMSAHLKSYWEDFNSSWLI